MSVELNTIETWLKEFVERKNEISHLDDKDLLNLNLFENGLIDSMGVMNLVIELEKDFDVLFTPDDFQDRRFTSIAGLKEIIREKKGGV